MNKHQDTTAIAPDRRAIRLRRKELKRLLERMERKIPDEFVLAMIGEMPVRKVGGLGGGWQ